MANNELCIIGQQKSESNIKLLEEAKKAFSSVFFVPLTSIYIGLTDKFSITYRVSDILKFRAILPRIPKNLSSYAYQLLSLFPEETYMAIRPISFLLADERFFLLTVLRKRGINTINLRMTRSSEPAGRIIEQNSFPLIIRTPEKKTGVVVRNKTEAKGVIDTLGSLNQPILIEDMAKELVSVYVTEPEVIAAVKKKTKETDVVFAPGELKNHKLDTETQQLALDAAKAIEAQAARVDIALGETPRVTNVELNPDLIAPSKATGADLPKKIVAGIKANYKAHKERPMLMKFFEDAQSVVKDVLKTKTLMF
ncbi:MAG: RimK family alpha-L-glutamate ligase [Candidatus Aenigmatarchaeota archaeon]